MIQTFYYITGNKITGMGLTNSGKFSLDRTNWKIFTTEDIKRLANNKPIPAAKKGKFYNTYNY